MEEQTTAGGTARRLKLEDLAKATGFSRATVWRALNKPELVSPRTVALVEDAMARIGYVPDVVARTFRGRQEALIALILPTVNLSFGRTMREIGISSDNAGFEMLVGVTDYDSENEYALVRKMLGRRVPGLITTGTGQRPETRRLLAQAGIPVVQIWDIEGEPIQTLVGFHNFGVGQAAARHLIERGRRRIATIYTSDRERSLRRLQGFRQTIAEAGLESSYRLEAHVGENDNAVSAAMDRLVESVPDIDGIFINGDKLALEAVHWCHRVGRRVPDDIAILGFGDRDFSMFTLPAISTIRVPEADIGAKAAEVIYSQLAGVPRQEQIIDLGFELIARSST